MPLKILKYKPFPFFCGLSLYLSCLCFLNHVAESFGLYFLSHSFRFSKMSCLVPLAYPLILFDFVFWKAFLLLLRSTSYPFLSQDFGNKGHESGMISVFCANIVISWQHWVRDKWCIDPVTFHFRGQCLLFNDLLYLTLEISSVLSIYGSVVSS